MEYISPLTILAKATDADTKSYPKDPDPRHWRTIEHSHVHIDKGGHIDGGAGGKFTGKPWTSAKHPHKAEGYPDAPKPVAPPTPPKTAEDLRAAWKAVAKERMEIHRAKTERGKKAHEEKLDKAFKAYTDMRSEIEARDPAEAAKFRPTTGGAAGSKKTIAGGPLGALVAATTPPTATPATGTTAKTPAPPTPAASPLASLGAATSGITASGASEAECKAGRAKVSTLAKYDAHRDSQDDADYAELGFTPKEREEFEAGLRRIFANSSYGLNIDQDILGLVLKTHFKNQYETHTSGGADGPSALRGRATAFGHLLGTKKTRVDSFPPEIREKYGSLVSSDIKEKGVAEWYGDSLVRFKKKNLAGRVTYTCGDSLGVFGHDGKGSAAGDADHPSIATFLHGRVGRKSKSALLAAARKCKDIDEFRGAIGLYGYMEMQYHGDLTADDIESVVLHSTPNPKIVNALKAKGIKVYYKDATDFSDKGPKEL